MVFRSDGERGATAVVMALLLTVLLGFAGLAVDLGASYAKHQQLQNSADAAALALAQEFALDKTPCVTAKASGQAGAWRDGNINNDAHQGANTVTCDGLPANQLRVVSETQLAHWFMPVVGKNSSKLSADATVEFGVPGTLITSPVTVADCAVPDDFETESDIVVWFPHPSGKLDPKDAGSCGYHEKYPPGGFGVLQPDLKKSCGITVTLPVVLPSAPGASEVTDKCMSPMIGAVNFVPIFDESLSSGSNAEYVIVEFAAIRVDFIGFGNKSFGEGGCPDEGRPAWTHKNQDTCMVGTFMGLVSIEEFIGKDLVKPGPEDTAIVARLID